VSANRILTSSFLFHVAFDDGGVKSLLPRFLSSSSILRNLSAAWDASSASALARASKAAKEGREKKRKREREVSWFEEEKKSLVCSKDQNKSFETTNSPISRTCGELAVATMSSASATR